MHSESVDKLSSASTGQRQERRSYRRLVKRGLLSPFSFVATVFSISMNRIPFSVTEHYSVRR